MHHKQLLCDDIRDRDRIKDFAEEFKHRVVILCLDLALESIDCKAENRRESAILALLCD